MVRFHFLPMENSKEKMIAVLERILAQPNFASVAFVDAYRTAIRPEFGLLLHESPEFRDAGVPAAQCRQRNDL